MVALGLLIFGVAVCVSAAEPLQDAHRLMAHGEFEQAIETLEKILARAPKDARPTAEEEKELRAEATFLLARAHESLGNLDTALRAYRVVTHEFAHSEVFANASLALAQLYMRQDQPEKAATALEAAISRELTPEHEFRAQLYLAEAISMPGTRVEDLDRALDLFHTLDEKAHKPADIARLNYGLGFCYQRKDVWRQAERYYIAVAETAPKSLWAAYARMQRIAYYRRKRFNQDAARLEKQLRQQRVTLTDLAQAEPRAANLQRLEEKEADALLEQSDESELPQNAVFAYKGYSVTADRFSISSPDRALIGRGNVSLVYETKAARTEIRAATVSIDLKRLHAAFSGNVSFETTPKRPGAKPRKIADLAQLIINLDTGWFRFRSAESSH